MRRIRSNAHLFINYLLRPEVAAKNSSTMHFATSNAAAYPLVDPAVYHDRERLSDRRAEGAHGIPNAPAQLAYTRELNRTWTRFKTGH